jgi:D-aminopeptidase
MNRSAIITAVLVLAVLSLGAQDRKRTREYGIEAGMLEPGAWNAITDVLGVEVGHRTLVLGDSVRSGVTVILPHGGNLFQEKVPAAVAVGNGFGKAIGFTQVQELGNLETPIALTSTLNVFSVADGLVDYMLSLPGNEGVVSVNPVVGETNDGWLNDIRSRPVTKADLFQALSTASSGPVAEGNVGAGTGTRCLGFKGGIGTSSRILPENNGGYTVGVLVQTNFGGMLRIDGAPVGEELNSPGQALHRAQGEGGSCMIVIATNAPLSDRNLERLARRSFLALGLTGSTMSNGSGDYAIAFSTHPGCRIPQSADTPVHSVPVLGNDFMNPLFQAVVEATEESIYNSLFMAEDMKGYRGRETEALPIERTLQILERYGVLPR